MALMYASIISCVPPVYSRRDAASINYTPMRGRVCYRRLEKSSALERHSSKFQYGRRSDRRDACLPIPRRVIGSTDIRLFYEVGGATDEFIALILNTMLSSRELYICHRRDCRLP